MPPAGLHVHMQVEIDFSFEEFFHLMAGLRAGAWFGEGTVIKAELRRYDLVALRDTQLALMRRYRSVLTRRDLARLHWRVSAALARRTLGATLRGQPAAVGTALAFLPALLNSTGQTTRTVRPASDE